jgi:hypothetical protein
MKVMKCPRCEEISTFSQHWSDIVAFEAPLKVNADGKIEVDYYNTEDSSWNTDIEDPNRCVCNNCCEELSISKIAIVETEDEVLAE